MNTSKNIIISYFYNRKNSAIIVASVAGVEGVGEEMGIEEREVQPVE